MKLLRILFTGLMISFLGTLPLGTVNVAAMQLSVTDGIRPAIYFVTGALLIEMIYVRVSLVAMTWVFRHKRLFRWLEWASVAILLALSISSFLVAADPVIEKNALLSSGIHRFWLGVLMSALNPVQIPFWFGWSSVLFSKKILERSSGQYNIYILGIGAGTFIGNLIFIFGGKWMADSLQTGQDVLHYVIGGIFLLTAIIIVIRIVRKKDLEG